MSSSSGDIVKIMKILISQILRFRKKLANMLNKKMKIQKMAHFVFNHISYNTWSTEMSNIPF